MHPDLAFPEADDAQQQPPDPPPSDLSGEDVTGTEPVPPDVDMPAHLASIDAALVELLERIERDTERAQFRERVIDRQHADIERLRAVERVGALRPVVTDLCQLRNGLLRQAATVPDGLTREQMAELLASFADLVTDALERCGVAVLDVPVGAAFVAGKQQVVGKVEVTDPALDATVAEVRQDGYVEIDGGKVVLPARVTVNRVLTTPEGNQP